MATYGGGTVFSTNHTSADVGVSGTAVAYTVPAGNYYAEFKSLGFTYPGSPSAATSQGTYYIENDNGVGGWTRDPNPIFQANVSGVTTTVQFDDTSVVIFYGQRIVLTNSPVASAGIVIRFVFTYNQYTPST